MTGSHQKRILRFLRLLKIQFYLCNTTQIKHSRTKSGGLERRRTADDERWTVTFRPYFKIYDVKTTC